METRRKEGNPAIAGAVRSRRAHRIGGSIGAVLVALLAGVAAPSAAVAQLAVVPHVGTLGIGVDGALRVSEVVGLRAGLNVHPWNPESELDDVDYELELASPSFTAMIDLHPGGGSFRVSGGVVVFGGDLTLTGTPTQPVEIGDRTYQPSEVGTVTGTVGTNDLAPYIGIGFGGSAQGTAFFLDLGVAFHGEPTVDLAVSGPFSSNPELIANLEAEERNLEDEIVGVTVYPVLSLGVSFAVR